MTARQSTTSAARREVVPTVCYGCYNACGVSPRSRAERWAWPR